MSERWKPLVGETYYFMYANGAVGHSAWYNGPTDTKLFEQGNCFRTEAEAQSAAEKVKSLLLNLHEQTTNSSQLPKLTAEVFDRPDCPKGVTYATVDEDGSAYFHYFKPLLYADNWEHTRDCVQIPGKFDSSHWCSSFIERPANLPSWCMFDAIGWHKRAGYFKITNIDDVSKRVDIQQVDDRSEGYLSFHTVCTEVAQARPRPYNTHEMEALVGKVLKHSTGSYLVDAFEHRRGQVKIKDVWRGTEELSSGWTTPDGSPCGKFEHLNEKGEWVE